ncbi:MAG: hypothetical protein K6E63_05480 [Lachnospiraceae bacterium]|nr:hypothetical protein [Lachnospiraceae bacterium]
MNRNQIFTYQPFILLTALTFFLAFCMDTTAETLRRPQYMFFLLSVFIVLFVFRQIVSISEPALILLAGVMLRTSYILYTAIWTRQHDVIDFGTGEGHAGYIEYIYSNLRLPGGDPRQTWAFFQPPLHHIIAGVWMRFCAHFQLAYRQVQENVQLLTLFYICSVTVLTFFICKELKLKSWGIRTALLIVCAHPALTIMSGSINNDALSLVFAVLAVYLVILWYKAPSYRLIVMLALSVGASMMAKLSGGMVAPAIAALFVLKLIKDRKNALKYISQFAVFGVIVFPLGLWWEIRNKILYDMPFNYIPGVGEQFDVPLIRRIFDIRMHSIYPSMISNGDAYNEFNVPLTMFKTSLFDDANLSAGSGGLTLIASIMFITALALAVISLIATVMILTDKKGRYDISFEHKLLFGILYVTLFLSYLSFAFSSNNYSAMNFRYIALIIPVEAVFLGIFTDAFKNKQHIRFRLFAASVAGFAVASGATYLLLGFSQGS